MFSIPFIVAVAALIVWDPFRVYRSYTDYYTDNHITINMEASCLDVFLQNKDNKSINSFIVGSSRSQAFKTPSWKNYLSACTGIPANDLRVSHFNGGGLGLYRAHNIVRFLDRNGNKLDNLLLVMDNIFLQETENPTEHLAIQPYKISGESPLTYYLTFLRASRDFDFLKSYLVFKITGRYMPYMGNSIHNMKHFHRMDNKTGDLYYGYEKSITADSIGYYDELVSNGTFYKRSGEPAETAQVIAERQRELLKGIKAIVDKHKTNIKIVICPLYDQKTFNNADREYISGLFGKDNVFDFSGVNELTTPLGNFYETNHFRPNAADKVMESIYCKDSSRKGY